MRQEQTKELFAGDIAVVAGMEDISIGDTITSVQEPRALPRIRLQIAFSGSFTETMTDDFDLLFDRTQRALPATKSYLPTSKILWGLDSKTAQAAKEQDQNRQRLNGRGTRCSC